MTQKLRQFLVDRNMTQRELAALLGMSEHYISRIVNERTPVTRSFKGAFLDCFGAETTSQVFDSAGCAGQEAQS